MIKLIKGRVCLSSVIKDLPSVNYCDDTMVSARTHIEVSIKSKEELIKIGALRISGNGNYTLIGGSIGITNEMHDIILAGKPIMGYIVRDSERYFIRHNRYFYNPVWFNYSNTSIINCDLLVINDKDV